MPEKTNETAKPQQSTSSNIAAVSEFFFALTPEWVLRAVEAGGFEPTGHCSPLTCLENRVYDLRLEDGSHVVAKFYRPGRWSRAAILDEHVTDSVYRPLPSVSANPVRVSIPGFAPTAHIPRMLCNSSAARSYMRVGDGGLAW